MLGGGFQGNTDVLLQQDISMAGKIRQILLLLLLLYMSVKKVKMFEKKYKEEDRTHQQGSSPANDANNL